MLQRIQSVFLLLASGAAFSLESPAVNFMSLIHGVPNAGSPYNDNVFNVNDDKILWALSIIGGVGFLITLFLYKKRATQALLAMLCNFIVGATLIYGLWDARETFAKTVSPETTSQIPLQSNYGYAIPILIVAMILSWLAVRFIRRDEKLVRSADRLR